MTDVCRGEFCLAVLFSWVSMCIKISEVETQRTVWNLEEWPAMDFSRLADRPEQMTWTGGTSLNRNCWGSLPCQRESCFLLEEVILHDVRETLMVYTLFFRKYAGKNLLCHMHKKLQSFKSLLLFVYFITLLLFYILILNACIFNLNKRSTVSWANGVVFNLLPYFLPQQVRNPLLLAEGAICHGSCSAAKSDLLCVHSKTELGRIQARCTKLSPLVCKTAVVMPMLRSSNAFWNHWVYWECTIIDLDV